MKKINILFVNPPSIPYKFLVKSFTGASPEYQTITPPLGILYLSSYIKKYNADTIGKIAIFDYVLETKYLDRYTSIETFMDALIDRIDFTPDLIAYSVVFSSSHLFFEHNLSRLKTRWPEAKVVVGGNSATNTIPELFQNPLVDFVVKGEGEVALSTLLSTLSTGDKIEYPGLYSRGSIDTSLSTPALEDLNIPYPDYALLDIHEYLSDPGMRRNFAMSEEKKGAILMTSRGCPYRCTFCASHTVHGRPMRYRSIDDVTSEVMHLHTTYGVTIFIILDDLFTAGKVRTLELLQALKALAIPDFELQFPNALAVNTLNDEIMDALIDTGMTTANVAVESGSKFVQRHIIKKNVSLSRAKRVIAYFNDRGITTRANFIFGYPEETVDMMRETIDFAIELGADWNNMGIVAPLKGAEMYDQLVQSGAIEDTVEVWADSFFTDRNFDTDEIKAEAIKELSYRANLEVNFLNNRSFLSGNYTKAIRLYYDVVKLYPFQIIGWYCIMLCYERLGEKNKSEETRQKLHSLLQTDERSIEMYRKYADLMPHYAFTGEKHD